MFEKFIADIIKSINGRSQNVKPKEPEIFSFENVKFFYDSKSCEEAMGSGIKTDVDEFIHQYGVDNSTDVYKDKKGNNVLRIYCSVPTFDEGDREWDSYRKFYIVPEKNCFKGIFVFGGYSIAKIYTYTNMRCADEETKKLLEKAGVFSL